MTTATAKDWAKAAERELADQHTKELERTAERLQAQAEAKAVRATEEAAERKKRDKTLRTIRTRLSKLYESNEMLELMATALDTELANNMTQREIIKGAWRELGHDDLYHVRSRFSELPEKRLYNWLMSCLYERFQRTLSRLDPQMRHGPKDLTSGDRATYEAIAAKRNITL